MNPLACPDEVLGDDHSWRRCGEVMPPYGRCVVQQPHRSARTLETEAGVTEQSPHPFVGGKGTDLCRACGGAIWSKMHDRLHASEERA